MNLHTYCFKFVRKNPKWSVANFFLILLNYPLEIVIISFLSGQIFSRINNINKDYKKIVFLFVLTFIIYVVLESSIGIKDKVDVKYFPKLEREIRLNVVDLIFNKVKINYDNIQTGEVIARLLKAPTFVSIFFTNFNKYIIPFFITFAVVIVYLFILNVKMGVVGTISIIIYIVVFYFVAKRNVLKASEREKEENKMLEDVDDTLNNCLSIISCGQKKKEEERLNKLHDSYDKYYTKQLNNSTLIKWISALMNVFLFGVLIFFTLYLYKRGDLSPAVTISLITMTLFLVKHLRVLSRRVCDSFYFFGSLLDNNKFLKKLELSSEKDGIIKNVPINGRIEFRNVYFKYPNTNKYSLKNVSFIVNPGDKVALIGKSGSGKSSILKLILGFYKPEKGTILINGKPLTQINRDYLRSNISIVNQNVKLFNRSVLENICYGTKFTEKQIESQIKNLDIMKVFHNLPNGLQSNVGKYGDKLSGGQKQIIYLLRCYYRNNPLILLDEPTSNIDDFHKKYALEMIKHLTKKSTLIIVSHDPTIYNMFNRKIHINEGQMVSDQNTSNQFSAY